MCSQKYTVYSTVTTVLFYCFIDRVEEMFKQLDRDGDGTLDYNEFAQMLGI
jgi:Ca2+-binding EF-hand superfamily protein